MEMVDEQANKLALTRSDAIEQAMELWLLNHAETEEEAYFQAAANEMNADARKFFAVCEPLSVTIPIYKAGDKKGRREPVPASFFIDRENFARQQQ